MNDNPATIAEEFAIWLESIPAEPPFFTRPDFAPFADMTDEELDMADEIIAARAATIAAEAANLGRRTDRDDHG